MANQIPTARRQRRKDARPQEIVEAAFEAFCENGFAATRLDEVARRAGIAKGTIYLYFDNKQALFQAVIEEKVTATLSEATELLEGFDGATDILLQMILTKAYTEMVQSPKKQLLRIIIGEGHRFPELRKLYYDTAMRSGLELLDRVVERGIARGEFRKGPAAEYPRLIMAPGILASIWLMTFSDVEELDIDRYFAAHMDLILNGLRV